jgi:tetratricopeptide (TPR) repeat protein
MIGWFKNLSDANKIAIIIPVGLAVIGGAFSLLKLFTGPEPPPGQVIHQPGSGNIDIDVDGSENIIAIDIGLEDEKLNEIKRKVDILLEKSDIKPHIKAAIEKIFLDILNEQDIPQWQWSEKLQEIAKRHQELLAKWQTIQLGDPAVDKLRDEARRMIELGEYDKADKLLQDAIEIDRKAIQSQQEKLDDLMLSLAQSLASRAELAEAKLDYKKAIDFYKDALDSLPQNQQIEQAVYINNLGTLYYTLANYREAESLYRQALKIDQDTFEPNHPKVAIRLNNLAELLRETGRFDEAEPMYRRALKIDQDIYGPNHPEVAIDLNNLALLLRATNRLSDAKPLYKRALIIWEKSLGKNHPQVAIALNNLAELLKETGRFDEAEALYKRALTIWENSLGKNHPKVATTLNNLAVLLQATNRLSEAESLMERALVIREQSFGPDHPDVALSLWSLAVLYNNTNRLDEAKPLYERALRIYEKSFGPDHPNTIKVRENLEDLLSTK